MRAIPTLSDLTTKRRMPSGLADHGALGPDHLRSKVPDWSNGLEPGRYSIIGSLAVLLIAFTPAEVCSQGYIANSTGGFRLSPGTNAVGPGATGSVGALSDILFGGLPITDAAGVRQGPNLVNTTAFPTPGAPPVPGPGAGPDTITIVRGDLFPNTNFPGSVGYFVGPPPHGGEGIRILDSATTDLNFQRDWG
jgi:hypothetical protein